MELLFAAPLTYRDVPNWLAFLVPLAHIDLRAAAVGNVWWFARPAPPAYLLIPHTHIPLPCSSALHVVAVAFQTLGLVEYACIYHRHPTVDQSPLPHRYAVHISHPTVTMLALAAIAPVSPRKVPYLLPYVPTCRSWICIFISAIPSSKPVPFHSLSTSIVHIVLLHSPGPSLHHYCTSHRIFSPSLPIDTILHRIARTLHFAFVLHYGPTLSRICCLCCSSSPSLLPRTPPHPSTLATGPGPDIINRSTAKHKSGVWGCGACAALASTYLRTLPKMPIIVDVGSDGVYYR